MTLHILIWSVNVKFGAFLTLDAPLFSALKSVVNREIAKKSVVNRELEVPWGGLLSHKTIKSKPMKSLYMVSQGYIHF